MINALRFGAQYNLVAIHPPDERISQRGVFLPAAKVAKLVQACADREDTLIISSQRQALLNAGFDTALIIEKAADPSGNETAEILTGPDVATYYNDLSLFGEADLVDEYMASFANNPFARTLKLSR